MLLYRLFGALSMVNAYGMLLIPTSSRLLKTSQHADDHCNKLPEDIVQLLIGSCLLLDLISYKLDNSNLPL